MKGKELTDLPIHIVYAGKHATSGHNTIYQRRVKPDIASKSQNHFARLDTNKPWIKESSSSSLDATQKLGSGESLRLWSFSIEEDRTGGSSVEVLENPREDVDCRYGKCVGGAEDHDAARWRWVRDRVRSLAHPLRIYINPWLLLSSSKER
jgi:hypothetical protein